MTGREEDYTWSKPYVDNSQVIVVKKDAGISALSDLAGKTVGVQAASAALQVLQDEEQQKALADTFAGLQEFADYNSAFVELQPSLFLLLFRFLPQRKLPHCHHFPGRPYR